MGDRRNTQIPVLGNMFKHKHLVLDQRNINAAKRYFGVVSEQEAIDKALSYSSKNSGSTRLYGH